MPRRHDAGERTAVPLMTPRCRGAEAGAAVPRRWAGAAALSRPTQKKSRPMPATADTAAMTSAAPMSTACTV